MSQMDDIKAEAQAIQVGLKRMGKNRVVALSVHVHKEVVDELEERVARLLALLDAMG